MTGLLVLSGDPIASAGAATKNYVDTHAGGVAGTNLQLQYNNNGAMGGSNVTTDSATKNSIVVQSSTTTTAGGIQANTGGSMIRFGTNNNAADLCIWPGNRIYFGSSNAGINACINGSGLAIYPRAGSITAVPSGTVASNGSVFDLTVSTLATSTVGQSSGQLNLTGNYWTGSASAQDYWSIKNVVGNGTNAGCVLTINHAGSPGTTGSPVAIQLPLATIPVYANNAAATGAGLTAGCLYRTGADPDQLCIVH